MAEELNALVVERWNEFKVDYAAAHADDDPKTKKRAATPGQLNNVFFKQTGTQEARYVQLDLPPTRLRPKLEVSSYCPARCTRLLH